MKTRKSFLTVCLIALLCLSLLAGCGGGGGGGDKPGGSMTDVSMPVVSEEACIVMNRAGFLALKKLVDEIAAQIAGQQ